MRMAVVVVLGILAAGQSQRPPVREAQPAGPTASIAGRVTDAESGAPLPRMVVTLVTADRAAQRETTTSADGRYEFTGVAPGSYAVLAASGEHRSTHLRQWFGATGPASAFAGPPRLNVELEAGEARSGIDIAVTRALAIEGRVFSQLDEPMANVEVTASRADGRAFLRPAYTDDLGRYRLYGLMPGRYRVCAGVEDRAVEMESEGALRHVRTCHLSAMAEAEANDVTLAGRDASGIDIRVQRTGARTVSGIVVDAAGAPGDGARVGAWPLDGFNQWARATVRGGAFTLTGLAPGRYMVTASLGASIPGDPNPPARDEERAYALVDVRTVDETGIALTLAKDRTVNGALTFEGRTPPGPLRLAVYPRSAESRCCWFDRQAPHALVGDDMTFRLNGLYRLPLLLQLGGLPDGWALRSVRHGGRDVTFVETDFGGGPDARVELVVTSRVAQPSVRVIDEGGAPVGTFHVVALPANPARWLLPFAVLPGEALLPFAALPGGAPREGVQRLGSLLPGDYLLAALAVEDFATFVRDEARIADLAKIATPVTFAENDNRTVDLRLARLPEKR